MKKSVRFRKLMLTAFVLFFALGAGLTSCERSPTSPRRVVTLAVQPNPVPDLRVGETVQLNVTVTTRQRNRNVTFEADRPSVATVSADGRITALSAGLTTITVTSVANPTTGRTAIAVRVVEQVGEAARIDKIGGDGQPPAPTGTALSNPLVVRVVDNQGNPVRGATVSWQVTAGGGTVSPPSTPTDAGGIALTTWTLGPIAGDNVVTARVAGHSATFTARAVPTPVASVEVTPPTVTLPVTGSQQFTARVRDAQGNELTGRIVTWTSSNPAVAATDATGLVRGIAPGAATITATSEGRSGTASVTVTQQ